MSKSPVRDYSRLIDSIRTTKKDADRAYFPTKQIIDSFASQRILTDMKMKLQLALKHNTNLLDENSMLSEMVNNLRYELKSAQQQNQAYQKSSSQMLITNQKQREKLMEELEIKQKLHESQLDKLLKQISDLHTQKNTLQMNKTNQLSKLKEQYEKTTFSSIQNLRNCQNNSKQLYQKQISGLKEVIDRLEHERQNQKTLNNIECNRLQQSIKRLESQISHITHKYDLGLKEAQNSFENQVKSQKRKYQRDREIENSTYESSLKRLKNQISQKKNEIAILQKKVIQIQQNHQNEHINFKTQKENLLSEITNAELEKLNALAREKSKLNQLNKMEIDNLLSMNQTLVSQLNGQINRLQELILCKTMEIKRLYSENQELQTSMNAQRDVLKRQNQYLKKQLKKFQQDNIEELELFKIKMAKLFHSDVDSMSKYYDNQLAGLTIQRNQQEKINVSLKQKLYYYINENMEIRKQFQIELSKHKARVQDLKVKIAAMSAQHKQQVLSIGTKIQMTSQTLVRQTEQKQKSVAFYEAEKKKFHNLINNKDKEIADLLETVNQLKVFHEREMEQHRNEKISLKSHIQENEYQIKRIKQQFTGELAKKDELLKVTKEDVSKQMEQIRQLSQRNEQIEGQNIKLQKQLEHILRENRALASQLGLKKGYIETLQLQSCAAIQDEKNKVKLMMNNSEVSLRDYFEDKIKNKDNEIKSMKALLSQKQEDIRQLILKYNGLEKRLQMMMENQTKLIDFQQKVKNIGMDNNLIKNLAELFRKY